MKTSATSLSPERPIQVGDLVAVVRAHCEGSKALGRIFTVARIAHSHNHHCGACDTSFDAGVVAYTGAIDGNGVARAHPLPNLKRIPPLDEIEGEKDRTELDEKAGNYLMSHKHFIARMKDMA